MTSKNIFMVRNFLLIVFLKGVFLFLFWNLSNEYFTEIVRGISIKSNDYIELIDPVNNYIECGAYALNGSNIPYIGRLPGYSFPYIIFRFFLSEFLSNQLLILSQIILSSVSILLLTGIFKNVLNNKIYYISIVLLSVFPFFLKSDLWTLSASFSASAMGIHIYYLYSYFRFKKRSHLFYAGLWLTWLFLLRPFTLPYFIIVLFVIFIINRKYILEFIKLAFIFVIPLLCFESFWIIRNYQNTDKIIPLQDAYVPGQNFKYVTGCGVDCVAKYSVIEVRKLVAAWGGNSLWFVPGTEMNWFLREPNNVNFNGFTFQNKDIYSAGFTKDSLILLKHDLVASFNKKLSYEERFRNDEQVVLRSKRLKHEYSRAHPFDFYVLSHFKRLSNFLFVNVTADWPGKSFKQSPFWYQIYKSFVLILYGVLLIIVFVFPFLLLFNRSLQKLFNVIILGYVYSLLFVFTFLVELAGITYFITGYVAAIFLLGILISEKGKIKFIPFLKKR